MSMVKSHLSNIYQLIINDINYLKTFIIDIDKIG